MATDAFGLVVRGAAVGMAQSVNAPRGHQAQGTGKARQCPNIAIRPCDHLVQSPIFSFPDRRKPFCRLQKVASSPPLRFRPLLFPPDTIGHTPFASLDNGLFHRFVNSKPCAISLVSRICGFGGTGIRPRTVRGHGFKATAFITVFPNIHRRLLVRARIGGECIRKDGRLQDQNRTTVRTKCIPQ